MNARNPYFGPQAISENCSIYGREVEIGELRDLLIAERIVLFYSPSGAGKTSLIQAGLLPELRDKEGFRVSLIKGFRGGHGADNIYLAGFFEALESALPEHERRPLPTSPTSHTDIDTYLTNRPSIPQEDPSESNGHILIFDQFEEIFTLDPFDHAAKLAFFEQLGHALKDRTRWALFSIREDYVAELDDYLHLLPTQLKIRYRLGLLDRPHALQAIENPAREKHVEYAPGAATILVDDLCKVYSQVDGADQEQRFGNFVEPVQLQVVCYRLWERLFPHAVDSPATISMADVKALSVDSALEDFYAEIVKDAAAVTHVPERDIREWVEGKLITARGIRGQVLWEPQKSGDLPNKAIECLENAHLVRVQAPGNRKWYELAHDRLVKPVTDNNRAWMTVNLSPLQHRTLEWIDEGRNPSAGLSLIEWLSAWRWSRANRHILRQSERDFLKHSIERIALISLFPSILVIAVVTIGILGIRYLATSEINRNNKLTILAYEARSNAIQHMMDKALIGAVKTVNEYRRTENRHFRLGAEDTTNSLAATVRETLITTLHGATNMRRLFVTKTSQARTIAYHPSDDGALIAYPDEGGKIVLAHIERGPLLELDACKEKGEANTVLSLAFSRNGAFLAAGCEDGSVAVWTRVDGTWIEKSRWQAHERGAGIVAFNRHSSQVASGSRHDSRIMVMHLNQDGSAVEAQPEILKLQSRRAGKATKPDGIRSLAFSPAEDKLVAGDTGSRLWVCNGSTRPVCTASEVSKGTQGNSGKSETRAIAFSEDGRRIATGHASGELLMWDVGNRLENRQEIDRARYPISCVTFIDMNGKTYLVFGADSLRQVALDSAIRGKTRQKLAEIGDVSALSFNAPKGLLAVVARSGYVAVLETRHSRQHFASKLTAPTDDKRLTSCARDTPSAEEPHRSAVINNTAHLTRLIIACDNKLLLIEINNFSSGEARVLQTIPAEKADQGHFNEISLSAAGKRIATLGSNHIVKFWTLGSALMQDKALLPLDASFFAAAGFAAPKELERIFLSPDGNWLICVFGSRGDLLLVDLHEGARRKSRSIPTPFSNIHALAFSADGRLLVAAGSMKERPDTTPEGVAAWEFAASTTAFRKTDTPILRESFDGEAGEANDIAVVTNSSGKQSIVAGDNLGMITIWDVETKRRQELRTDKINDAISQLVVAQDQPMLTALDEGGKITQWDVDVDVDSWKWTELTSRNPENRLPDEMPMELLGFGTAGRFLVSRAGEELTIWDMDIASLRRKICDILGAGQYPHSRLIDPEVAKACY